MSVEVYVDFVCPWCYIGHRRLERVRAGLPAGHLPKIIWRSYQLDPEASAVPAQTAAEAMRGWYPSAAEAEARIARIVSAGREEGLLLDLERAQLVNTFDAHRVSHLAMEMGLAEALHERIYRAYHTEGRNIADHQELTAIAGEAGMDRTSVEAMLASDRFGSAVRADTRRASARGINSVPSMALGNGEVHSVIQEDSALSDLLVNTPSCNG
ncbi:DsbA family oxidoreductase [Natronospirillum operosum]|uniref:DsbA family oxidoreductase n=1 Tax=Natronospirillum operosum TaxID=2759953 RepID=UPI001436B98D|nr:DsbA family oxidoreductase [Natronospirillum operosum]